MGYMREVQAYPFSTHLHPSVWSDTCNGNGNGMMLLMVIILLVLLLVYYCVVVKVEYISISVYQYISISDIPDRHWLSNAHTTR